MQQIIFWLAISGILLLASFVLLLTGIVKKNLKIIYICILLFFIFLGAGTYTAYLFIHKTYDTIKHTVQPRPGQDIYIALFGKPVVNPVKVLNYKDQHIPGMDCCIWLEVKLNKEETERLLSQTPYKSNKISSAPMSSVEKYSGEAPGWWKPETLGDSMIQIEYIHPTEDRIQLGYISTDSTRLFYSDILF